MFASGVGDLGLVCALRFRAHVEGRGVFNNGVFVGVLASFVVCTPELQGFRTEFSVALSMC